MENLAALDLFAGAGGFSLGMKLAGVDVVGAVEIDKYAAETYRHNFSSCSVYQEDISLLGDGWFKSKFSGVDIVAGGPPCQGFSVAGPSQYGKSDERNKLVLELVRVANILRPQYVILENVKGIISGRLNGQRAAVQVFMDALSSIGYECSVNRLQAANYGVPQNRERVFVIAARAGLPLPINIPSISGGGLNKWRSAWEALSDLPQLLPGEGTDEPTAYGTAPKCEYQQLMRAGSSGVCNHIAMKHTARIVERLKHIPPGKSLKDAPGEHGQRRRNSSDIDATDRYKMNCSRLAAELPALCVPANFQTIHVHPQQHRMLTAREGARLQSFPDWFVFKGPRTLMSKKLLEREGRLHEIGLSQYNQIGNAVPPLLSKAICEFLLEITIERGKKTS